MLPVPVGNFAVLCHYLDAPPCTSATSFSPRIRGFVQTSKSSEMFSKQTATLLCLGEIGRLCSCMDWQKHHQRRFRKTYIRATRVLDAIHNIRPLPSAVNTFYVGPAFAVFRKADRIARPLLHFRPNSSDPGFCTELLPRCASRRWSVPRRDLQWFAPPSGFGRGRGRSGLAAPWLAQANARHRC